MDLVPYHECHAIVKFLRTDAPLPPPPGFEEYRHRVCFKVTFINTSMLQFDSPPRILSRRRFLDDGIEIARRTIVSSGWAGEWIDDFLPCFAEKLSILTSALAVDPRSSSDRLILCFTLVLFGGMFPRRFVEWRALQVAEAAVGNFPADKAAVRALEEVENEEDEKECCICLDEFSIYSKCLRMPCSHVYHRDCLVEWLEINHVCPMCRYALPIAIMNQHIS